MAHGGFSAVNVSPNAIFKPVSWHGAYTHHWTTYVHTRRMWRRRTLVTSQACCVWVISRCFWLPPLFFPCVRVCFHWILSAVAGTLSKCLYLFSFILFLTSSHSCLYTRYTLWMFGAAATTFPSAHACSHVLQEHTHFNAEPWISEKKKALPAYRTTDSCAVSKKFLLRKKGTARIFNIHFKVDNAADK